MGAGSPPRVLQLRNGFTQQLIPGLLSYFQFRGRQPSPHLFFPLPTSLSLFYLLFFFNLPRRCANGTQTPEGPNTEPKQKMFRTGALVFPGLRSRRRRREVGRQL